jgi:hypothetical protein
MADPTKSSSRAVGHAAGSALAYGDAAVHSFFAFARAGARSVGAFVEAGVQTVEAFDGARRTSRRAPKDPPAI